MKVLQLCGKDFWGAGRAAYRLHKGLQEVDVDSSMWVGAKRSSDDSVINLCNSGVKTKLLKLFTKLEKILIKLAGGKNKEMFSLGLPGHNLKRKIEKFEPDVIHIHWINRGFMNLQSLKNIDIPVVISLHDMWWFSGGCHYDGECDRYKFECGKCPVLFSKKMFDLSFKHLQNKKLIIQSVPNLTIVGLSEWMASCVNESSIGGNQKVVQLPNGIDTNQFQPQNKFEARNQLGLPLHKKLILFAAVDALSESRKGYKYIAEALKYLTPHYELVIIGEKSDEKEVSGLMAHFIGEIKHDEELIKYLSAVDVAVVPSLQENLSNLIMETLACATPVVAFNIGGNGDMIHHKDNGYLAQKENAVDLAKGIEYCCNGNVNENLSLNARKSVVENFGIVPVAKRYKKLYEEICSSL